MTYYLFPFDKVPKNSRIVLYGAGNVGKQFYDQIIETNFCKIALWLDKKADGTLTKKPERIADLNAKDYDTIVIAIENDAIARDVKIFFENYKIPENKIIHRIIKRSIEDNNYCGETEKFLLEQIQRLWNNNKRPNKKPIVAMIHCDEGDGAPSETFIKLQRNNIDAKVNYYNYGIPPTKINGINLMTSCSHIANYEILVAMSLINENTDVVFAQFGVVGAGIVKICRKINIPLIVHFHGYDISVKSVVENYRKKYLEMFEYATYVIAVSKCMKEMLMNLGCSESKIIYNPCGPNDSYYNIQPAYNKKLFIGAGRFVQKKAPQNTILAFIKVLEKHPDAKLILAGEGELLETCKELVKQNHIEKSVLFPGVFKAEQLEQWLSEATAFVQHSITAPNGDMEGTPVIILEASLAGLPVISTFHAGIPDVIIDGKTGLLVNEGDIEGMTRNMIWILDNPEKAKEIGMAGKENIWKNFNMKKHIKTLDEIIYKTVRKI